MDDSQDAWASSALPLYVLDPQGRVQALNAALAELLPWSAAASGLPPPSRLPDGALGSVARRLWRVPGAAARVLSVSERADRSGAIWGVVVDAFATDPGPQAAPSEASARDVELLGLSHELRGPLNAILGFADVLLHASTPALAPAQWTAANHIAIAGERLLLQLDGVLDLARIRLGRLAVRPTATMPTSVWRQVELDLAQELKAKGVALETAISSAGEATGAMLDPQRLQQLMAHLVVWMLRASRAGQGLAVRCEESSEGGWAWSLSGPVPPGLPLDSKEAHPAVWALCLLLADQMGATLTALALDKGDVRVQLALPRAALT